jgi:hypothetical protein
MKPKDNLPITNLKEDELMYPLKPEPVIQARKDGDLIVADLPQVPTGGGGVSKEQEPMAYLCENAVGHKYFRWKKPPSAYKPIALYTAHAAPQRIWQGLTDGEVVDRANAEVFAEAFARGVAWAELKLKEKNND